MLTHSLFIIAGLALLLVAGETLVRGAVGLAAALRIPTLLISLTIVAFGTSAPELVVSVQAVLADRDGIAIGNIIGSNIANVFLVLGLPALIYPISAHVVGLRRHAVVMLAATVAFAVAAYGVGAIDTRIGGALLAGLAIYLAYMLVRAMRAGGGEPVIDEVEEYIPAGGASWKIALYIAVGLIGLPLGAHLLVSHGSAVAAGLGVREELIGLTIIAFGTSLPELATVIAAAVHKKSDVAIGGVVGSNIFNILAVGGAVGLTGRADFGGASLALDLPVMGVAALALAAFIFSRRDIGRLTGLAFLAAYFAFLFALGRIAGVF